MKRNIIKINHDKCNGCGLCIPNCPEGAIQLIDGKARLVSDLLCDGLGACLGHCPEGAIAVEEREAEPYDERKVMAMIIPQGENTLRAHLRHLEDHGEVEYHRQALEVLQEHGITLAAAPDARPNTGCPGSRSQAFAAVPAASPLSGRRPSQLGNWPIQLNLISPAAGHFAGSDLLIAADCSAFTLGDFHHDYLAGKTLIIACPKLDSDQEVYLEKIKALIDQAQVNTITVMIMEVPCCGGLLRLVQAAAAQCSRKVPVKLVQVSVKGEILREEWAL
ncbi:MAG TPA: 4Fe-4S binding protein [bacterium]|nr:4Fe-4S binding protein [bacterium]HPR89302.1 4Fe-4S binding protein [bacterium]